MGAIRRGLIGLALLGGMGYALYRFGLSDEAKEQLKAATSTVKSFAGNVYELIEENRASVVEDVDLPNRNETAREWADLGY